VLINTVQSLLDRQQILSSIESSAYFAADSMGLSSINFFLVGSVKLLFCKSDVSAVQGHPRSLILLPIESVYATSYILVRCGNLGLILHRFRDIASFCTWPHP